MKAWHLGSRFRSKWGVAAPLVAFLAVLGLAEARPSKTAGLSGLARASGTVTSPSEFKAAKVFFRNPDKRMLYMVYTNAGKFQAMNLMPGNYDVSAEANGLESDAQKIELKAGSKATVNLSLHPAVKKPGTVQMLSYEELYPKGEGRTIAERTCIRCHGANFLPSKVQWDADRWNGAIDTMMAGASPAISPQMLPKDKREILVNYLVENFGPHSEMRAISQAGMPVDETKISKAEYVEFYFPIDPPGFGHNDPQYSGLKNVSYGGLRTGQDVILDQQGYAWCTDRGTPNRIARLDPRTGEWMSFFMPHPTKGIHDFIIDNDGMIWVPEWLGPGNLVDVFDTKTLKWVASYPMDPDQVFKTVVRSQAIVIDSKHNVYMNWNLGSAMSRLDWQTKRATVTPMPNPQSFLYGVVKDSKDNIWISEFRGGKIARMDAVTQKITEYTPPTYPALIRRLTVDSHDIVWFDLYSAGKFDRLDPNTGKITEWDVPFGGSQPYSLKQALGSNKMWISDGGAGGALLLFDPDTEKFTIYPTPQITDQPLMRIARDGAVWYCPRSAKDTGIGVMYPDMTKMTTLAAYPTEVNPNY